MVSIVDRHFTRAPNRDLPDASKDPCKVVIGRSHSGFMISSHGLGITHQATWEAIRPPVDKRSSIAIRARCAWPSDINWCC